MPDLSNREASPTPAGACLRAPLSRSHLHSGVPGRRVQPLLQPAHLTDGVVVTHQGVLPSAVRDGVEIPEGTETGGSRTCVTRRATAAVPLTRCCPTKSTPQFYPPPASDRMTAPGDGGDRALDMRTRGRNGKCCSRVPCWRRRCFSGTPSFLWRTFSGSSLEQRRIFPFKTLVLPLSDRGAFTGIIW